MLMFNDKSEELCECVYKLKDIVFRVENWWKFQWVLNYEAKLMSDDELMKAFR